jgi:C4-dicarboxylate-specific signal transduction histidine kinase
MLILQSVTVRLSNVKNLSITARKHHSQPEDGKGCRARSHRAHASGVALSKTREELEARVQKRTAKLIRANEALRQDAEQLSAIIATNVT